MRWPDYWKGPYWEPRDIWIGVYWDSTRDRLMGASVGVRRVHVYVCIAPCLPVRLTWVSSYTVSLSGVVD